MNKFFVLILVAFSAFGVYMWYACSSDEEYIGGDDYVNVEQSSEVDADDDCESDVDKGNDDSVTPDEDNTPKDEYPEGITFLNIVYNGSEVTVQNPYHDVEITNNNGHVTINGIAADMVCKISGVSDNGSLKVYGDKSLILVLQGVNLLSNSSPAINIQSKQRVDLIVEEGCDNYLSDAANYIIPADEDAKATLFSEGQLIIGGLGNLSVKSVVNHAIASDNYIKIENGYIKVVGAAKDALHCNSGFVMDNGLLNLTAVDDAIQVDEGKLVVNGGTIEASPGDDGLVSAYNAGSTDVESGIEVYGGKVTITTTGDKGMAIKSATDISVNEGALTLITSGKGAKAISCDGNCAILGGNFNIKTLGDVYYISSSDKSSAAGIKCDGNLLISGGVLDINCSGGAGKGINVDGSATVTDGVITIVTSGAEQYSSKAKAFKSEGDMSINGGSITITTYKDGAEGVESKKTVVINGGELCINTYDDAINAGSKIEFNGGKVYAFSTNNDAVDCNNNSSGSIAVNGGIVVACSNAGAPEGALDSDHGTLSVTGGYLFTMGSEHSVPTNSTAKQNTILFSNFAVDENDYLAVYAPDNRVILALKSPCSRFSRGANSTMVTAPDIENGVTYSIGVLSSEPIEYSDVWQNLYIGGQYVTATQLTSMTVSSTYTGSSSSGGPGGPGGPGGGFRPW